MKCAVDFDGVLAIPEGSVLSVSDRQLFLDSKHGIKLLKPAPGALELLSVLKIFGETHLVTSRPQEHLKELKAWLGANIPTSIRPKKIICCGLITKNEIISRDGFHILIDDDLSHITHLTSKCSGILWRSSRHKALIKSILASAVKKYSLRQFKRNKKLSLLGQWSEITDRGASSVFILATDSLQKIKMRICHSEAQAQAIEEISTLAALHQLSEIPRLYYRSGLVVLKEFIPTSGDKVSFASMGASIKIGEALGRLHNATLNKDESVFCCCSADLRNIIWNHDLPVFVDLGCCIRGPALLDLFWAFCFSNFTTDNFRELLKAYLLKRRLSANLFWNDENANFFYTWAFLNISRSIQYHCADKTKQIDLKKDLHELKNLFHRKRNLFRQLLDSLN